MFNANSVPVKRPRNDVHSDILTIRQHVMNMDPKSMLSGIGIWTNHVRMWQLPTDLELDVSLFYSCSSTETHSNVIVAYWTLLTGSNNRARLEPSSLNVCALLALPIGPLPVSLWTRNWRACRKWRRRLPMTGARADLDGPLPQNPQSV